LCPWAGKVTGQSPLGDVLVIVSVQVILPAW
jgi:hypothetical protein